MAVSRTGRSVVAILVLAVAVVLAGCTTSDAPVADTAVDDVRTMLRARAQFLVDKDVDGYLRTVVDGARPLEEAIARGAAAVPLSFVNVTFNPSGVADPDATSFLEAELEIVYGYADFPDNNRFRFGLRYDIEQRDGLWTITGSRHEPQPGPEPLPEPLPEPDDGTGTETADETAARVAEDALDRRLPLPFWARFPVEATRSEHFLVLHPPGLAEAAQVVSLAEQAREQLAPRLRFGRVDGVHLVLVARDRAEYNDVVGRDLGADNLAVVSVRYLPSAPPEARQMTINLERVLGPGEAVAGHAGEATSVAILQHELAHLALSGVDSAFTPAWVQEGAAMHLAGERRLDSWTIGLRAGWFDDISIAGFGEEESLGGGAGYAYVNAAVSYLIETFGVEQFWEFYIRFQPVVDSVSSTESAAGFVLDAVYDIDLPELDRRTREWMAAAVAAG